MPDSCVHHRTVKLTLNSMGEGGVKATVPELPPWRDIRIANTVEHN